MDAGILELRDEWLLLGAGSLVAAAGSWLFVDAGILGICGREIPLPLWILGAAHWLLRRDLLWIRLCGSGLPGRVLEWKSVQLQPCGEQCEREQRSGLQPNDYEYGGDQ